MNKESNPTGSKGQEPVFPGAYPITETVFNLSTENKGKEGLLPEEHSLNRADFGNSKNKYDMHLLDLVFIRRSSKKSYLKPFIAKFAKEMMSTGVKSLANVVLSEAISHFSSGDTEQTSEQIKAVSVTERITTARTVVNEIIAAYAASSIKPEETYRDSYLEWKDSRKANISKLPEDVKAYITTLDIQMHALIAQGQGELRIKEMKGLVERAVWLSNLNPQRKDITHKNYPEARKTQRYTIISLLKGAETQAQINERRINFQHIINASSKECAGLKKVIIWRGDLPGGGKSFYTGEQAESLGLPLQVVELGQSDDRRAAFHGSYDSRAPLRERIGTLWYDIGDAVISNTIFYFNEADSAMKDSYSSQFKKLWEKTQQTITLDKMGGIELYIGDAIFIGDGNTPIHKLFDRAMLERVSYEDFNSTNPSQRLYSLESAAAIEVAKQSLSNEDFRSKIDNLVKEMIPFIQNLDLIIGEQSFRPGIKLIADVAALAAAMLEQEEEPDFESAKEHVIRGYERLNPDKNIRLLDQASDEPPPGQKVGSPEITKVHEELSPRVRRIMQENEWDVAKTLARENPNVSKNWEEYVRLKHNQKKAATQIYNQKLRDKMEELGPEYMIPETIHSILLNDVPKHLISTHNFLRGLPSPTPTRPSSRASNTT